MNTPLPIELNQSLVDVVDHTRQHQMTAVLRILRRAGRRGVPFIAIRDATDGADPTVLLDEIRGLGVRVVRCPSDRGVLAVLLEGDAA